MNKYLIVGASSGIGQELKKKIEESGNQVIGTFKRHKPEFIAANIQFHHLNVLDDNISLDFLPDQLDGFDFCPGSINLRPFERIKPQDFESDYKLQVIGAIKLLQMVLPQLKKFTNASIVLFATVAVQTGMPFHTQVSTTKGAIEGLTWGLAAEYAPQKRVNCIAPSLTDTPLASILLNKEQKRVANALRHPLKRIGTAEDITNRAACLHSYKASWTTGQILHIDGRMASLKT